MSSEITPLLRKRKKIVSSNAFYQQMVILLSCVFIISPTSANVKKENSINHKLDVIVDLPFETAFERKDINLLNWQHWPHSRYASHHPREFVTMATIHSDPEAPALKEIKQDPFNLMTLKVSVGREKEFGLLELLKSIQMKGFAVMHDGKLVFETYDQRMQKHDIQVLQSSSKTFTGMLIHKLVEDGLLDLEANVNEYLPNLGAGVFKGSTLQNLLDMEIGYPDFGS